MEDNYLNNKKVNEDNITEVGDTQDSKQPIEQSKELKEDTFDEASLTNLSEGESSENDNIKKGKSTSANHKIDDQQPGATLNIQPVELNPSKNKKDFLLVQLNSFDEDYLNYCAHNNELLNKLRTQDISFWIYCLNNFTNIKPYKVQKKSIPKITSQARISLKKRSQTDPKNTANNKDVEKYKKVVEKHKKVIKDDLELIKDLKKEIVSKDDNIAELKDSLKLLNDQINQQQKDNNDNLTSPKFIEIYAKAYERFNKQDGKKEIESIKKSRSLFEKWESYFFKLCQSIDNLHYELMEILEDDKYSLSKQQRVMVFPVDLKNREMNIDTFEMLIQDLKVSINKDDFTDKLLDNLLLIPGINVRAGTDLDYFFDDNKQVLNVFIKQSINTILLHLKILLKTKDDIMKLMTKTIDVKGEIYKKIQFFDPFELIDVMSNPSEDISLESIIPQIDNFLQDNYQAARTIENLVDEYRKQFFNTIDQSIFKTYNGLKMAKINYSKEMRKHPKYPFHKQYLEEWESLYTRLIDDILAFLKKQLNITKIDCKPGDPYDDKIHKPYDQSEHDERLPDDSIKLIINDGFKIADNDINFVIKPVDVIVVKKKQK